ncbi:hypothetical protein RIF29_22350 [Crotalaria pallida]|uniref:DUF4228 domain-containing protein n=1 Tax=Crotalaria pallida TaxID=3830 RepID=A0AAN9I7Z6_CROPI
MGNTASFSCLTLATTSSSKANKTATLLDTQGKIREIKLPVRSGELMIEELGHVIVPVEELLRTRRVSAALPADQELVAGKVYLLVPVSRVHTKATELEMEIVEKWCNCEKKNKSSSSGKRKKAASGNNMAKVSPVSNKVELLLEGSNFNSGKLSGGGVSSSVSSCDQLRRQARWNPVLEPILESSRDYTL